MRTILSAQIQEAFVVLSELLQIIVLSPSNTLPSDSDKNLFEFKSNTLGLVDTEQHNKLTYDRQRTSPRTHHSTINGKERVAKILTVRYFMLRLCKSLMGSYSHLVRMLLLRNQHSIFYFLKATLMMLLHL